MRAALGARRRAAARANRPGTGLACALEVPVVVFVNEAFGIGKTREE